MIPGADQLYDTRIPCSAIWLSGPLVDGMQHVNGYPTFGLAKWLEGTFLLLRAKAPLSSYVEFPRAAKTYIDLLLHANSVPQLDVSKQAAITLQNVLNQILDLHSESPDAVGSVDLFNTFSWAFAAFDNAFMLELGRLPIFYVMQKGIYDTKFLILDAAAVYGTYRDRVPKLAIDDTNQAGRCLAFNLPTAAGFHIARATESVIKAEMAVFGATSQVRDWSHYGEALAKTGADRKVIQIINEIRLLHRNPLFHPEDTLSTAEALTLWSICVSAIQAMVADMEKKAVVPDAEIVAMLPAGDDKPQ